MNIPILQQEISIIKNVIVLVLLVIREEMLQIIIVKLAKLDFIPLKGKLGVVQRILLDII